MKLKTLFVMLMVLTLGAACVPPPPMSTASSQPQPTLQQPTLPNSTPTTQRSTPAGPDRLDRTDPNSVMEWINYALENRDPDPILQLLVRGNRFGYAFYIEGGQTVTHQEFASQLTERIAAGPRCIGYLVGEYSMEVWVEGWAPAWEMTESCYLDCQTLNPPRRSNTTGLLFDISNKQLELAALYLNTPDNYYFMDKPLSSCSQPYDHQSAQETLAAAKSCRGAPQQRLIVGEQAQVCTLRDSVFMRNSPSRSGDRIGSYAPGSTLDVLSGPVCANSWSWWEVQDQSGKIGWMSEGGDSVDPYFLCPHP